MGSRKRLPKYYGALAQLGARLTGSQEVTSSSLVRSTIEPLDFQRSRGFSFGSLGSPRPVMLKLLGISPRQ